MKSELLYSGMLVKELSVKSGVNKYSLDNYLNKRGQKPSIEVAVKIARVLGVSVEYLATGEDADNPRLSSEARTIGRIADQLNERDRRFILDLIKWMKVRR